jgi:cell division septum initiation protein DivIVA
MALDRQSIEKRESLSSSASEQVRAIIEAAEASATEILRQAEKDAREIRAEAAREAQAARAELSSLIDGLRAGANRLNADLELLEGNLDGGGSQFSDGTGAPTAEAEAEVGPEPEVAADVDGARLVALNMALNGTPRDETDRYLSENFQLDDRMTLLDEVYSSVQS